MPPSSALKSLLTACVLAALVFSTVESYNCRSCHFSTCGVDTKTTCEASQGCFSYKQELKTLGQLPELFKGKGCSSSRCAPLAFSASLGINQTFRYDHRCCQAELCNKEDFQVPQKSSDPNGIKCPACYKENEISCDPVPLACTGSETKCVEVTGTGNGICVIFAMGCATETACNLNISILDNIKIRTRCVEQRGESPTLTSITSSILTCLFLLKVVL